MTATAGNEKKSLGTEEKVPQEIATGGNYSNGSSSRGYSSNAGSGAGSGSFERGGYSSRDSHQERPKAGAMEVHVDHNIEKAMRILKRKLIKEGLFKELKSRRYYEKPSERRKRKEKESKKKVRKEEARAKKNPMLLA